MPSCPQCGQENLEAFKFCGSCGTALVDAPAPREVRKTVTVVFSDVTGSTALGERLDPESLRRVMSRYFDEMQSVVEAHGGTVEKFIGDAVMAVFGIPVVHEDDALRAVRAVAEMRTRLAALNEELERDWGVRIAVRTGVNTGEVVAGDASGSQRFATGDAVNVAKRFEEAAPPGEILLGEATHHLVRDAVEVEPVEPLALKGKSDPLPAFRLLSLSLELPGRARRLDSPMVGRERERAALQQSYARAVGERSCHRFTVLGSAGVGKSRLVADFLAGVDDGATLLRGRTLPYGEGITFWPLLEALRDLYGEEILAGIRSDLEGDESAELVVERIAAAVGLGDHAGPGEETAWAVRRLFEARAQGGPIVIVFDDLQWGEPTFLDLVEHLADWSRDAPILLICLARPEFLDERPDWGGGKFNATSVLLEPLSESESGELLENLLGRANLARDVQSRITDAAEGNPLFVEEMLAMLIDDGLLARDNGSWVPAGDLSSITVPPTIQALLAARLDRLAGNERAVIERGSVEGKVFHRGAIAELSDDDARNDVGSHLQMLVRKELIRPDRTDLPGEDAFRFRHLLIRDAAYEAMPKELRAELHERFASWLEGIGARDAEFDEIMGYHLEQAYFYRVELAPIDEAARALAQRAGERLAAGARRALMRADTPATISLAERALALLPDGDQLRPRLHCNLGFSLQEQGQLDRAQASFEAGLAASTQAGDRNTQALIEARLAAMRTMLGGTMEEAVAELERLAAELEMLGDESALVEVLPLLGQHLGWAEPGRASEVLERGATIAEKLGDVRIESECIGWLAVQDFWGGTELVEHGIAICKRMLDRPGMSKVSCPHLLVISGNLKRLAGREEEGEADIAEGNALMSELGRWLDLHAYTMAHSCASLLAGRFVEAEEKQTPTLDALRTYGEAGYLSTASAIAALALCGQGRYLEAQPLVDESRRLGAQDDLVTQIFWRAAQAQILVAHGDFDEASKIAREALDLGNDSRTLDWAIAALGAAEVFEKSGQPDEARRCLEGALEVTRRKGIVIGSAWMEQRVGELSATQSP